MERLERPCSRADSFQPGELTTTLAMSNRGSTSFGGLGAGTGRAGAAAGALVGAGTALAGKAVGFFTGVSFLGAIIR